MSIKGFQFNLNTEFDESQSLVGFLPIGISDTDSLLRGVAKALNFPDYFGENWNALYDCLRDFSWVQEFNIILVHTDLPLIPEEDLKIYLDVLKDSCSDWKEGENHKLIVIFDKQYENRIANLLSN